MPNPQTTGAKVSYTPQVKVIMHQLIELGLADLPLSKVIPLITNADVVGVVCDGDELFGLSATGHGVALVNIGKES